MIKSVVFLFIALHMNTVGLFAQMEMQHDYPEVGKPCPEFVLRNISYFPKREASLNEFKGKWLVLDFWNIRCGACVASFPKTSHLQQQFRDKVQFMMVGIEDKDRKIQPMYAKFRDKEKLIMPCAFDSLLANQFDIYTSPYIIIIDDNGIVQGITATIDSDAIATLLKGGHPELVKSYRVHEDIVDDKNSLDINKPILVNNNGAPDSDFLFRSIISLWNPITYHGYIPSTIDENIKNGMFQIMGATLDVLYNFAYYGIPYPSAYENYGKYSNIPILEIADSSLFKVYPFRTGKNRFSYSLCIPRGIATKEKLQSMMQKDLESYFGFKGAVELRSVPCLKLVASHEARERLPTKMGVQYFYHEIPKASFEARNWPISNLLNLIKDNTTQVVIDGTGIVGNIDIKMDCVQSDFNSIQNALNNNGLKLVPEYQEMKVLVITDVFARP